MTNKHTKVWKVIYKKLFSMKQTGLSLPFILFSTAIIYNAKTLALFFNALFIFFFSFKYIVLSFFFILCKIFKIEAV